jgi:hypothetical protein
MALVDEFRQRAEPKRDAKAAYAEIFAVLGERIAVLRDGDYTVEDIKAELDVLCCEMVDSLESIGDIVIANTAPAPPSLPAGKPRPKGGPIPIGTPGVA